jgi:putative endonuclease
VGQVIESPVSRLKHLAIGTERAALLQLQSLSCRLGRAPKLPPHLQTGVRGEFEALFYLRSLGYTVVERRWRSPELNGDLDLVAWEGDALCFVEVKTRTARDRTPAALAIDGPKRTMLQKMAASYMRSLPEQYRRDTLTRFDIVSVYLLGDCIECELVRDAFPRR